MREGPWHQVAETGECIVSDQSDYAGWIKPLVSNYFGGDKGAAAGREVEHLFQDVGHAGVANPSESRYVSSRQRIAKQPAV
eukprot:3341563-Pyramimonas_sp.AAC.3